MKRDPHRTSLPESLARYSEWLMTTRRFSLRTTREYRDDVAHAVEYLETRCHILSATSVQRQHLASFLAQCAVFGHAASTRRRSVAAIRSFFAFLVQERIIARSPAEDLLPPERETRPPRVLSEDEYTRLRHAAADNTRDAALIELALQTGLRLSEIARLKITDIVLPPPSTDITIGHVRIVGRRTHGRTVTLNARACAALRAYLAEREASASPALFLTKFGGGIGPRGIEDIVAKRCKEAGISGASVHTLRHTMAIEMLKRGASVAVVAEALGHVTTETMAVYEDAARERMDAEMQRAAV